MVLTDDVSNRICYRQMVKKSKILFYLLGLIEYLMIYYEVLISNLACGTEVSLR